MSGECFTSSKVQPTGLIWSWLSDNNSFGSRQPDIRSSILVLWPQLVNPRYSPVRLSIEVEQQILYIYFWLSCRAFQSLQSWRSKGLTNHTAAAYWKTGNRKIKGCTVCWSVGHLSKREEETTWRINFLKPDRKGCDWPIVGGGGLGSPGRLSPCVALHWAFNL